MPVIVDISGGSWTYGAEHELADWDTSKLLPKCFTRADDWTLVNSNGIAVQPSPKIYHLGGEINTPPSEDIETQLDYLAYIIDRYPEATVNHRSNLHVHIRVPGLVKSLKHLKLIQRGIHSDEFKAVLNYLEPIPVGQSLAEKKREKRRKVSHHTFLTEKRIAKQLEAKTLVEFFESEVPRSKAGQVMWHAQPRVCVNLRQILQTDTIEFRHFPGTLDLEELSVSFSWCRDFLITILRGENVLNLWEKYRLKVFPPFPPFDESREIKYQATASHNGLKQREILDNIRLIERGEFSGSRAEERATQLARGMSR